MNNDYLAACFIASHIHSNVYFQQVFHRFLKDLCFLIFMADLINALIAGANSFYHKVQNIHQPREMNKQIRVQQKSLLASSRPCTADTEVSLWQMTRSK